MRYSQLKAFHAVATHGGFSRAAEAVHQTQPALSDHVRRLERDHDVLLFHRDRKRVRLTETGKALFLQTKRLFEVEQQIDEFLSESKAAIEGRLRIVADSALHIAQTLCHFRQLHPKVIVTVQSGNTEDVLAALRSYDAEIGIVGNTAPGQEFEVVDLGSSPIIAFAARGYLPKGAGSFSLRDLTKYPLVFREQGSRTRQKLEQEARRQKLVMKPALVVEGREAMREVVASGNGIGFVSEAEFGNDSRLEHVAITGLDLRMSEAIVYIAQRRDLRVIRAFMDQVNQSPS